MIQIHKKYRKYYAGENIVVERNYTNGIWQDTTEMVPNAVVNSQISNQAVILGNGPSRLEFNLQHIKNHKGGLLGSRALQSYGCNALYRDFTPDFLVATGNEMVAEIAASDYVKDNIVYTSSIHTLEYPNKFYLIPYDPYIDAGTTAAYIACFDGHKNLYLLGFDGQDSPGYNYNVYAGTPNYQSKDAVVTDFKWRRNFRQLAQVFDDVNFAFVHTSKFHQVPEEFRDLVNVRCITHRTFTLEADL
jgi:hypothetical protein